MARDAILEEKRMRKLVAIGTALWLAIGVAGSAAGTEPGNQKERQGRDLGAGKQILINPRFIPIVRSDLTRLEIDWVVLTDGATTRLADASQGLQQEDQDRLDLSFIPFLGDATNPRYTAEDVAPATRVGSAWFVDRSLYVALDPAQEAIIERMKLVVLNDTWSFTLQIPAQIIEIGKTPAFDPIRDLPVFRDFAETKVILPDAQSILIGGLDANQAEERASKIPRLNDIPGLARMFAGSAHKTKPDTLLILIRPSIIVSED
jgi:hypothetical protein